MSGPIVLTIAGSDSGGGAGIQADIKAISALGCYATSTITALTAQNTLGVQGVSEVAPAFVAQQLESVLGDLQPRAIKTGMMASASIIRAVVDRLGPFLSASSEGTTEGKIHLVVDPVTISTSNHTLLPPSAVRALVDRLLPLASVLTPNIMEAQLLVRCLRGAGDDADAGEGAASGDEEELGRRVEQVVQEQEQEQDGEGIRDLKGMIRAARTIQEGVAARGGNRRLAVLLKGGHLPLGEEDLRAGLAELGESTGTDGAGIAPQIMWSEGVDASRLSGHEDEDADGAPPPTEILESHRAFLREQAASAAPTKGQHPARYVVDVLLADEPARPVLFVSGALDSTSTHGTGCTLSAAIASYLALGDSVLEAVQKGIRYTQQGIVHARRIGQGHGPLNHGCLTVQRAIPLPSSVNPHPFTSHLIAVTAETWKTYVRHPFVQQLGKGTLPRECFKHYIIQDYIYLKHYARAHALGGFKANDFAEIQALSEIALHVARESQMHVQFCESFGVTMQDLQAAEESSHTSAYARYILDIGMQGDLTELLVAVFSCLIGYGEVGLWLLRHAKEGKAGMHLEGNPYRRWIEDYSGKEFQDAVHRGLVTLETRLAADPPSPQRLARLTKIWADCVRLEVGFWEMGINLS